MVKFEVEIPPSNDTSNDRMDTRSLESTDNERCFDVDRISFYEKPSKGISTLHLLSPNLSGTDVEDRKIKRQIANCNERRRMQSINAGFQALRSLLPKRQGDKISKAAILQQTTDFIQKLLEERNTLLEESKSNNKKRKLDNQQGQVDIIECLKVIDQLRTTLEKEKQLRIFYESALNELKDKVAERVTNDLACRLATNNHLNDQIQVLLSSLVNGHQLPIFAANNSTISLDAPKPHYGQTLIPNLPVLQQQNPKLLPAITPALVEQQQNFVALNRQTVDLQHTAYKNNNNSVVVQTVPHHQSSTTINPNYGQPSLISASIPSSASSSVSQHNLQAILEAIRHLEGDLPPTILKEGDKSDLLVQ